MELKRHNIITLESDEKYIITNETIYNGSKYYLLVGVTKDEKNIKKEIAIVEEVKEGNEVFIQQIKDEKLLNILTKILNPRE